jgi:hypothetical protein
MTGDLVPIASSTRRWDLARQAAGEVLRAAPWLDDPAYDASVRSLAFAEATAQLLRERLDRQGDVLDDGRPSPLLRELRAWQAQASRERGDLGLTPVARQRLGKTTSQAAINVRQIWLATQTEEDDS